MQYAQLQTVPRRSWWSRNWKWLVPVGAVIVILGCAGVFTLFASMIFGVLKSSEPYTESLAIVQADPHVRDALGSPIEAGFLVSGNINWNGSAGHADLAYSVSGPSGDADVYVVADRATGQWSITRLIVDVDSTGERIALRPLESPASD
jgi:hypothetical protein